MGQAKTIFSNINLAATAVMLGMVLFMNHSANAVDTQQWNSCRTELNAKGYTVQRQNNFCRRQTPAQWTCAQTILKKYHSLELTQETCLTARASELSCFNQVLNRDFDPYVAKRVCRLK